MNRLRDKVVIITGGSGGIGSAVTKLFLEEGAKVMLVDLKKETLEEITNSIKSPNLAYSVADVSQSKDTEHYVKNTLETFGKIDILFSNAGIEGTSKPLTEYPEETFDKVIGINLKGVWLSCQHVIPKMNDGGSIIISSSVAGLKGFPGLGAYVASKHGVVGIMRVAAKECGSRGIRVNTIHPGPINTLMMRRIEKDISPENSLEAKKGFEADIPMGRYGEPEEIAELVLFLASDESKYITGSTYAIDGGMVIN